MGSVIARFDICLKIPVVPPLPHSPQPLPPPHHPTSHPLLPPNSKFLASFSPFSGPKVRIVFFWATRLVFSGVFCEAWASGMIWRRWANRLGRSRWPLRVCQSLGACAGLVALFWLCSPRPSAQLRALGPQRGPYLPVDGGGGLFRQALERAEVSSFRALFEESRAASSAWDSWMQGVRGARGVEASLCEVFSTELIPRRINPSSGWRWGVEGVPSERPLLPWSVRPRRGSVPPAPFTCEGAKEIGQPKLPASCMRSAWTGLAPQWSAEEDALRANCVRNAPSLAGPGALDGSGRPRSMHRLLPYPASILLLEKEPARHTAVRDAALQAASMPNPLATAPTDTPPTATPPFSHPSHLSGPNSAPNGMRGVQWGAGGAGKYQEAPMGAETAAFSVCSVAKGASTSLRRILLHAIGRWASPGTCAGDASAEAGWSGAEQLAFDLQGPPRFCGDPCECRDGQVANVFWGVSAKDVPGAWERAAHDPTVQRAVMVRNPFTRFLSGLMDKRPSGFASLMQLDPPERVLLQRCMGAPDDDDQLSTTTTVPNSGGGWVWIDQSLEKHPSSTSTTTSTTSTTSSTPSTSPSTSTSSFSLPSSFSSFSSATTTTPTPLTGPYDLACFARTAVEILDARQSTRRKAKRVPFGLIGEGEPPLNEHWRPQAELCGAVSTPVDFIGRTEHFEESVAALFAAIPWLAEKGYADPVALAANGKRNNKNNELDPKNNAFGSSRSSGSGSSGGGGSGAGGGEGEKNRIDSSSSNNNNINDINNINKDITNNNQPTTPTTTPSSFPLPLRDWIASFEEERARDGYRRVRRLGAWLGPQGLAAFLRLYAVDFALFGYDPDPENYPE